MFRRLALVKPRRKSLFSRKSKQTEEQLPPYVRVLFDRHPSLEDLVERGDIEHYSPETVTHLITCVVELLALGLERQRWEGKVIDLLLSGEQPNDAAPL